jgi:hypothetical protein
MKRFTKNGWTWGTLVGLTLLAWSGDHSRAGSIPPGTYSSPSGATITKTLTVSTANTVSGTGTFATIGSVDISFPVVEQARGDTTTYSFSETLFNKAVDSPAWTDFEMKLGGNVGATFTGKPFSNKFDDSMLNKAMNQLTFVKGSVPPPSMVTFSFLVVVPNPQPNTSGVLILTETTSVPEPSTLAMSGIALSALAGCILFRRRYT